MHVSKVAFAIAFAAAIALVLWNVFRVRAYQRDYRFDGLFKGTLHDCQLGVSSAEELFYCRIGATEDALFLMALARDDERNRRKFWGYDHNFRRFSPTDLRIPWQDLECRVGKLFLKDVLWFENHPRRLYLYVPQEVGERVLKDAGRRVSGG